MKTNHSLKTYFDLMQRAPHLFTNDGADIVIISEEETICEWEKRKRAELKARGAPVSWAEIGVICEDPYIVVLRDLVEFPGGYRNGYIRIYNRAILENGAAGVAVLPVKDKTILLIKHYRHATRSSHWEIPRGFGQPGVDAETQAVKEIEEEIGGVVEKLIDLGIVYNNTGLEGNPIHLFLVKLASTGQVEREEAIETYRWVALSEFEQMIAEGEITDGFTLAAYARAKLKGLLPTNHDS